MGKPPGRPLGTRNLASYLQGAFPLKEILEGAACSPADAQLFDPHAPGETKRTAAARQAQGRAICYGCPVLAACWGDAYDNRRMGVYGGQLFDRGFWTSDGQRKAAAARSGVVQVVPVVQDSEAC